VRYNILCVTIVLALLVPSCSTTEMPERKITITIENETPKLPRVSGPPPEARIVEKAERSVCFYPCRYVYGGEIKDILDTMISPEGAVSFSEKLNLLVFSERKKGEVESLLSYVKIIDVYKPQILVEAKVVEITLDSDFEFELNNLFEILNPHERNFSGSAKVTLTTPGSNPSTEGIVGNFITSVGGVNDERRPTDFLRMLVTEGRAEILSSPNLTVNGGHSASIITGEEVPVTSQTTVSGAIQTSTVFKRVGVKLRVTPMQVTNDMVLLEVNPEVSTVVRYTSGEVSNPVVAVRNTSTTLKIKDGELIAIGGLMKEEERLQEKRIPVLSSIPILGRLFRSTRRETARTQLVFFLRITILGESKPGAITIPEQGLKDKHLDGVIKKMKDVKLPPPEDILKEPPLSDPNFRKGLPAGSN